MSIQETIKHYESRVEFFTECLSRKIEDTEREVYEGKMGCYKTMIADLQALQSEHKAEIVAAYDAAFIEGVHVSNDDMPPLNYKSAEDYYQKTFTSEKFKK